MDLSSVMSHCVKTDIESADVLLLDKESLVILEGQRDGTYSSYEWSKCGLQTENSMLF